MRQPDAAELAAGVGEVGLAAAQAGLGVDLDDVGEVVIAGKARLQLHHRRDDLGAVEVGAVVDLGDELEVLRGHVVETAGTQHAGVADEAVDGAEFGDRGQRHLFEADEIGDVGLGEDDAVALG